MPLLAPCHRRRTADPLSLYATKPLNPAVFAGVVGLLFGVATTACLLLGVGKSWRMRMSRQLSVTDDNWPVAISSPGPPTRYLGTRILFSHIC
jgi:hypothetical protein